MSLTSTYLGLTLNSPLVASSSSLNANIDNLRRLEDAGSGAVVLPSLFQEQIESDEEDRQWKIEVHADSSPEALSYFPSAISEPTGFGPERYLDLVRRATEAVSIPVVGSLNGSSLAGWTDYARLIEQAGAAAIELNMYYIPTGLQESGRDIEDRYIEIVDSVCGVTALPVSVKLPSNLSSIGHFAMTLVEHGAAGLVLFNRSLQPDIDLLRLSLADSSALSDTNEMRLPLLWTAILAGRTKASLATSTGVSTADDVVKCLLAGADVVMTTSALLRHDIGYMSTLVSGLRSWMSERGIAALADMRGQMSWLKSHDRGVYTRANYIRTLEHSAHH